MGYEVADLTAELSAAREEGAKTERTCAELSETLEEEREAKGAAEASLSSLEEHQSFLLEELKNDSKAQKRILDLLRAEKADLERKAAADKDAIAAAEAEARAAGVARDELAAKLEAAQNLVERFDSEPFSYFSAK